MNTLGSNRKSASNSLCDFVQVILLSWALFSPVSKMGRMGLVFFLSTHILVITYFSNMHTSFNPELLVYPPPH